MLFPKMAVKYIDPRSGIVLQVLGCIAAVFIVTISPGFHLTLNHKGIIFTSLSGFLGMIGALFYYKAVSMTDVSSIVVLTGLYPFFTVLLSVAFLREMLTLKKIFGMIMALIAMILLSI